MDKLGKVLRGELRPGKETESGDDNCYYYSEDEDGEESVAGALGGGVAGPGGDFLVGVGGDDDEDDLTDSDSDADVSSPRHGARISGGRGRARASSSSVSPQSASALFLRSLSAGTSSSLSAKKAKAGGNNVVRIRKALKRRVEDERWRKALWERVTAFPQSIKDGSTLNGVSARDWLKEEEGVSPPFDLQKHIARLQDVQDVVEALIKSLPPSASEVVGMADGTDVGDGKETKDDGKEGENGAMKVDYGGKREGEARSKGDGEEGGKVQEQEQGNDGIDRDTKKLRKKYALDLFDAEERGKAIARRRAIREIEKSIAYV